jgi:hypothetical protein
MADRETPQLDLSELALGVWIRLPFGLILRRTGFGRKRCITCAFITLFLFV